MPLFNNNSKVIRLRDTDFKNKTIIHPQVQGKNGLIGFFMEQCGHCVKFKPAYEKIAQVTGDFYPITYVDSKDTKLVSKFDIKGFPTVKYIENGVVKGDYTGNRDTQSLMENICTRNRSFHFCTR